MCIENLSVVSSFNLQGDAGPEGPAGQRVSQTLNNMVLILTHTHSIIILMIRITNVLFLLIGSTRPNWGTRKG